MRYVNDGVHINVSRVLMWVLLIVLLAFVASGAASAAPADAAKGSISDTVTNESVPPGPLQGIWVRAFRVGGGYGDAVTDIDGVYTI